MVLNTVAIGGFALGSILMTLKHVSDFYWKALDRRLTDISSRSDWFRKNYEGSTIHGGYVDGTICYIRCNKPKNTVSKLLRYTCINNGQTEITITLSKSIDYSVWDFVEDQVEERNAKIIHYDQNKNTSSIKLEISSFELGEVENVSEFVVRVADEAVKESIRI